MSFIRPLPGISHSSHQRPCQGPSENKPRILHSLMKSKPGISPLAVSRSPPCLPLHWRLCFACGARCLHTTGRIAPYWAGNYLFPYSMAGANRRTSVFCQGSEPGLVAAVQSTTGTELPGRGKEPPPTAVELSLSQVRFQPLPRAHRVLSGPRCRSAARCRGNLPSALPAAAPPCSAFRRAGAPRLAVRRGGLCPPAAGA